MTKTVIQIENVGASDLFDRLDKMENAINALSIQPTSTATKPETVYITRRQVADFFKITLVTVHDWTKKGILTAYKIANRVYYKRVEVEQALTKKGGTYA